VIGGPERLFEVRRAVPADRQQSIRKAHTLLTTNATQALTNGHSDGRCHAFSCELRQLLHKSVGLWVFDI
jgi:hypothetical protein